MSKTSRLLPLLLAIAIAACDSDSDPDTGAEYADLLDSIDEATTADCTCWYDEYGYDSASECIADFVDGPLSASERTCIERAGSNYVPLAPAYECLADAQEARVACLRSAGCGSMSASERCNDDFATERARCQNLPCGSGNSSAQCRQYQTSFENEVDTTCL